MRIDSDSPGRDEENLTILTPLVTCNTASSEGSNDDLRADSDSTVSHEHDDDAMNIEQAVKLGMSRLGANCTGKQRIDQEKRMRREIANSNERRRMQSINAGFQSLRALLPKRDGEKISKAAILQQTAEYVQKLQMDKAQLADLNMKYKSLLETSKTDNAPLVAAAPVASAPVHSANNVIMNGVQRQQRSPKSYHDIPPKKRKRYEVLSESDSFISVPEPAVGQLNEPAGELKRTLDQERRLRLLLEDQLRSIELNRLQTLGRLLPVSTTLQDYMTYGGDSVYLPNSVLSSTNLVHPPIPRTTSGFVPPSCTLPFSPLPMDGRGLHASIPPFTAANMTGMTGKSLEVMLEAIRHLEGELEPDSTTPGLNSVTNFPPNFYRPMAIRPDASHNTQTDSGISSPNNSEKSRVA